MQHALTAFEAYAQHVRWIQLRRLTRSFWDGWLSPYCCTRCSVARTRRIELHSEVQYFFCVSSIDFAPPLFPWNWISAPRPDCWLLPSMRYAFGVGKRTITEISCQTPASRWGDQAKRCDLRAASDVHNYTLNRTLGWRRGSILSGLSKVP